MSETAASSSPSVRMRHYKLVLLGDSSVGKSCLVTQFVRGEFHDFQEPTIGAAFLTATISNNDDNEVDGPIRLEIWDTAGQERYRSLAPMYYRGAAAAIVVYDVTSVDSFAGAKTWVRELQRRGDVDVVIGLAGNKMDCERAVSFEEATSFARDNGLIFMETSAKTAQNVRELFLEVAKRLPKQLDEEEEARRGVTVEEKSAFSGGCC